MPDHDLEQHLNEHYGGQHLLDAIAAGLAAAGIAPDAVTVGDLGPVDEFHVGGRPATAALVEQLDVGERSRVLDVGCGIGGAARYLAATTGCEAVGVDLNPDFVAVARRLTEWTGLSDRVTHECASVLDLPFDDDVFDGAVQLHVGMNIEDKVALFAEVARVLRPGGRFGIYDLVRVGDGDIDWPVPWASDASHSFVADVDEYRTALEAAGFEVAVRDRHRFALDFFAAQASRPAGSGPPPLGLHLIIGADTPTKLANLRRAVEQSVISPFEFVATLG